jgi:hypothetical protein
MTAILRAIWRSLCGDIWRRGLSRRSIAAFRGDSTGFDKALAFHDLQIFNIGAKPGFLNR